MNLNKSHDDAQRPASGDQPVTQDQLNDVASKIEIALHALLDGIEIVALRPDALASYAPEIKAKINLINPYH
jgi:hypothetical protein